MEDTARFLHSIRRQPTPIYRQLGHESESGLTGQSIREFCRLSSNLELGRSKIWREKANLLLISVDVLFLPSYVEGLYTIFCASRITDKIFRWWQNSKAKRKQNEEWRRISRLISRKESSGLCMTFGDWIESQFEKCLRIRSQSMANINLWNLLMLSFFFLHPLALNFGEFYKLVIAICCKLYKKKPLVKLH